VRFFRERDGHQRTQIDAERAAVKARHEDWYKGPLAPHRDSGLVAGTYGTVNPPDTFLPRIPQHLRRPFINIAAGDRVVLLKGPDQGKICEVLSVDLESESVRCRDYNQVRFFDSLRRFIASLTFWLYLDGLPSSRIRKTR
jgi:large subunit ribosomal protein L24